MNGNTTKIVFAICALAWVVLVGRAWFNVKGPEDFVITATQPEVEAFARDQLGAMQARSFESDVEPCAIIFEDSDGDLGTTPVKGDAEATCDILYFDEPGMAPLASIHTHGSHDRRYDSEVPSLTDLQSDIASRTDGYVSTPGGRLWRVDWQRQRAVQVCGEGCLPQDPAYEPCPGDPIAAQYTLAELERRIRTPLIRC